MTPAADHAQRPRYRMPRPRRAPDPRLSALSLLDEATHRLRSAPAATLGIYYASTLPFVLALLYFWADMSRSADAAERSTASALGLAALFVAMKTGQTVFAARMRARFAGRPAAPWTPGRLVRAACVQAAWQPLGLFVLPVSLIFPVGWAYAFYQNLTVCGDGQPAERSPAARAWRHALARPGQNHRALGVLAALGFCAWLALMVTMFTLPGLFKMFTGEENAFTRSSGLALFNSTFLAVSVALVYLAFDPLAKTFYALRCFYADAETTGEDLLGELNALPPVERAGGVATAPAARTALLAALLLAVVLPAPGRAADAPTPAPAPAGDTVSPDAMNRSMREVLSRREFAWRSPRPPTAPDARDGRPGAFTLFLKHAGEKIEDWLGVLRRWLGRDQPPPAPEPREGGPGPTFIGIGLEALLYGLLAVLAAAVAVLLFRGWQNRRAARDLAGQAAPAASAPLPDLADEAVLADQLPEDEWLTLARGLLARGERRLALRALYLSALASLGTHGLLGIARHKSNRDYQGELRRRARDRAGLQETFARLVTRFERVWYGSHPADDALLTAFQDDRDRLTAEVPPPPAHAAA
ncbi:MAG: DUF4129 domain-containing protein [Caulobacteraceae bacterium]|nr:DUF4129 domain-containing protein [Caulobacter sp.]